MGAQVAFIGLGNMGYPMAGHLQNNGHSVTVYNRTTAKAEAWAAEYGGDFKPTPAEAAQGAEIVFTCVGNDDDLRSVVLGDAGILAGLDGGALIVDHTTASAEVARELSAQASEKGVGFIDAPVSGGEEGAKKGVLTVMCGGSDADFARAEPVIASFARSCQCLGPVGAGQLTKMVNQICIAGVVQGLAEGINFAQRSGLDARKVIEVISKGAAQSWQMENRFETMIDGAFEFGFAVDWMRKDLGICLDEGRRNGASLPLTALVDQYYGDLQNLGANRYDTSSLIYRLRALDGK